MWQPRGWAARRWHQVTNCMWWEATLALSGVRLWTVTIQHWTRGTASLPYPTHSSPQHSSPPGNTSQTEDWTQTQRRASASRLHCYTGLSLRLKTVKVQDIQREDGKKALPFNMKDCRQVDYLIGVKKPVVFTWRMNIISTLYSFICISLFDFKDYSVTQSWLFNNSIIPNMLWA